MRIIFRSFLALLIPVIMTGTLFARDTTTVTVLKTGKFGGDVRGMDFVDANTGYAVGDGTNSVFATNSFIAKTTDGGNTWANITPPQLVNRPWSVDFVNANTGVVSGYLGMILRTTNGGVNWTTSTTGVTTNINEVLMTSVDTGYACGALTGNILKTIDGGQNWISIAVTGTNVRYGLVANGSANVWVCGTSGNTLKTTDGGTSWTTVTITGSPTCYEIIRTGADLWVFGSSNQVFRSTDGGASYALSFDNGSRAIYSASNFGASNFLAVGADGLNYRTTNGGTVFDSIPLNPFTGQTSRGVFMKSATDIIVGSDMGNIFRTTNAGLTWDNKESANRMYAVDFMNANFGVAVGFAGMVFKTTNAGTTWQNMPSGSIYELYDVQVFDVNTFYIAAAVGRFYTTTNGGSIFTERQLPSITGGAAKSLYFFNANTGFCVGEMGQAYRTTDAGVSWTSNFSWGTSFNNMEDVYFVDNNTGYITGERGRFIKSTDAGLTWDSTGIDGPNLTTMWEMDWLNATTGFMGSTDGCIFKTSNGGANWILLNDTAGMSSVDVIDIDAADTGRGLAVSELGYVFKQVSQTQWVRERTISMPFGSAENLWGVDFIGSATAFVSGYYGTIYRLDVTTFTGIGNNGLPMVYSLEQNYPNPFNPATVIKFSIPQAQIVSLRVFDILGREVVSLINGKMNAGNHEIEWDARNYPSGAYFYKLESGGFTDTKKMVLIK